MEKNRNRGGQQNNELGQRGTTRGNSRAEDQQRQTVGNKNDTSRTSNQGRKEASGGSPNTNNQGRPKGGNY